MPKLRTMKISSQTGAGQYTNHRTQGQIQLQPQSYRETNGSTASSSVDASESHQDTILGAKWNDFLKKVDSAKSLSLQNICTNIVIKFKDYQGNELCKIETEAKSSLVNRTWKIRIGYKHIWTFKYKSLPLLHNEQPIFNVLRQYLQTIFDVPKIKKYSSEPT
eukprot:GHVP01038724.1.p1 GENE.GHVP01038724.1~~GHVP01038724.1.p1  ORF type:complete len:163 (+),score=15.33 GHVP01038724.1:848-1336(+)